jgi:hypothetical protein
MSFLTANPTIAAMDKAQQEYDNQQAKSYQRALQNEQMRQIDVGRQVDTALGEAAKAAVAEQPPAIATVTATQPAMPPTMRERFSTPQPPASMPTIADQPAPSSPLAGVVAKPQMSPMDPSMNVPTTTTTQVQMPQTRNPNAALVSKLAGVQGAGRAAFDLAQAGTKASHAADDKMVTLLAKATTPADVDTAIEWGRKNGISIPDQVANDHRMKAKLAHASAIAHQIGAKGGAAQQIFKSVLAGGGDLDKVLEGISTQQGQDFQVHGAPFFDSNQNTWLIGKNGELRPALIPGGKQAKGGVQLPIAGENGEAPPAVQVKPGYKPRAPGSGSGSGKDPARTVQSTKYNESGELLLVMRDGTVKKATDENGKPVKGDQAKKLEGTLVGRLLGDPLQKDPVGKAKEYAGQVYPTTGTSPAQAQNRPPLGSFNKPAP